MAGEESLGNVAGTPGVVSVADEAQLREAIVSIAVHPEVGIPFREVLGDTSTTWLNGVRAVFSLINSRFSEATKTPSAEIPLEQRAGILHMLSSLALGKSMRRITPELLTRGDIEEPRQVVDLWTLLAGGLRDYKPRDEFTNKILEHKLNAQKIEVAFSGQTLKTLAVGTLWMKQEDPLEERKEMIALIEYLEPGTSGMSPFKNQDYYLHRAFSRLRGIIGVCHDEISRNLPRADDDAGQSQQLLLEEQCAMLGRLFRGRTSSGLDSAAQVVAYYNYLGRSDAVEIMRQGMFRIFKTYAEQQGRSAEWLVKHLGLSKIDFQAAITERTRQALTDRQMQRGLQLMSPLSEVPAEATTPPPETPVQAARLLIPQVAIRRGRASLPHHAARACDMLVDLLGEEEAQFLSLRVKTGTSLPLTMDDISHAMGHTNGSQIVRLKARVAARLEEIAADETA